MEKSLNSITVRKSNERGHANHGWLDSHFTFSFADYFDPKYMGFRSLRVINDDLISGGGGFGMHPHKDMEIISYIVEGELQHKDSMGNGSVIKEGNFQRITAGTGISHSEFNPSPTNRTHLLQIWILPEKKGLKPSYQELNSAGVNKKIGLTLVASPEEKQGLIKIHQDVRLLFGNLKANGKADYTLETGRGAWLQMIKGEVEINGINVNTGDGVSVENEKSLHLTAKTDVEFLLFDLK